jgi:phosphoglycolate/pyridoxal phosphate phosphatase family enzyme
MSGPSRRYAAYVFDCDGTLYVGERPLPGAVEVVRGVRELGARTLFVTNNPTRSQADYAAKLTRLGMPTPDEDVVSSIDALLAYLSRQQPRPRLLVIAEELLTAILRNAGFEVVSDGGDVDVVVVAFDRTFDYAKLKHAFDAVNAGARIVATNPDRYCPSPDGGLPDCAAMLAAIEACTGKRAEAIVGKPSAHMGAVLLERLGVPPRDALMIGDRLETDMKLVRGLGIDFALVLTGATSAQDAQMADDPPDYVMESLSELLLAGGPGA